ncbi:50S ribosomal protein L30 [Ferrovibrio sp. MS7]|jgi:large subunit ribosomal protein L30|uniref:50S ribosomal protein L30 n=1 Tax=Ferrovibrio TaxID=1231242 RepID=UPI001B5A369D|nr:50S ribosomal protein L30 [Ferrovibrio sp.]
MANKKVKVTWIRSANKRTEDQQQTIKGLGLRRLHDSRELEDTPAVRGMIAKVSHLVRVEG